MICPDQATLLLVHFYHSFLGVLSAQSVALFCVSIFAWPFDMCRACKDKQIFHGTSEAQYILYVFFYCYGGNFSGADSLMKYNGQV